MKKIISLLMVIGSLFFLGSTAFAEQGNFSQDKQPVTFELISAQPPKTGASLNPGQSGSLLPHTGEVTTVSLAFLGAFILGLLWLLLVKRRNQHEEP